MSHYQVLGVASTASTEEIRRAYRRLARVHHPDHDAAGTGMMAALNEAYRVLRHPGRRAAYDAELAARNQRHATARPTYPPAKAPPVRVEDRSPARYPWRFVIGGAVVGSAFVIAAAALTKPSDPPRPDNLLEPGSCVVIEANADAREVTCAGTADDLVVDRVVPLQDGRCPVGLSAYRDRQGMGYACVERRGPDTTSERAANLRSP